MFHGLADLPRLLLAVSTSEVPITGIESLYSQKFSVGIFYFLLFSIILFTGIVIAFLFFGKSKLKKGEKWMFAWIFLGIVIAVTFGAAQMLHGYLF